MLDSIPKERLNDVQIWLKMTPFWPRQNEVTGTSDVVIWVGTCENNILPSGDINFGKMVKGPKKSTEDVYKIFHTVHLVEKAGGKLKVDSISLMHVFVLY